VWAVGRIDLHASVALTWNGVEWSKQALPNLPNDDFLKGVDDVSTTEAWAVGRYNNDDPLILHRTSGGWTRVNAAPGFGGSALLQAVEVVASDDVWVGGRHDPGGSTAVLLEHWDGSAWTEVAYPALGAQDSVADFSAVSTDDIWSVGHVDSGTDSGQRGHWDGADWTAEHAIVGNGDMHGVDAAATDDVWAVGSHLHDVVGTPRIDEKIQHYDGMSWTDVDGVSPGSSSNALHAVEIAPDGQVWAVGQQVPGGDSRPLVEVWDGAAWSEVPVPPITGIDSPLNDVTTTGARLWAVGNRGHGPLILQLCPIRVLDSGVSYSTAKVARGVPAVWVVPTDVSSGHSIVDGNGMTLFDSGAGSRACVCPRVPGRRHVLRG
jgi:hypothetical protein